MARRAAILSCIVGSVGGAGVVVGDSGGGEGELEGDVLDLWVARCRSLTAVS